MNMNKSKSSQGMSRFPEIHSERKISPFAPRSFPKKEVSATQLRNKSRKLSTYMLPGDSFQKPHPAHKDVLSAISHLKSSLVHISSLSEALRQDHSENFLIHISSVISMLSPDSQALQCPTCGCTCKTRKHAKSVFPRKFNNMQAPSVLKEFSFVKSDYKECKVCHGHVLALETDTCEWCQASAKPTIIPGLKSVLIKLHTQAKSPVMESSTKLRNSSIRQLIKKSEEGTMYKPDLQSISFSIQGQNFNVNRPAEYLCRVVLKGDDLPTSKIHELLRNESPKIDLNTPRYSKDTKSHASKVKKLVNREEPTFSLHEEMEKLLKTIREVNKKGKYFSEVAENILNNQMKDLNSDCGFEQFCRKYSEEISLALRPVYTAIAQVLPYHCNAIHSGFLGLLLICEACLSHMDKQLKAKDELLEIEKMNVDTASVYKKKIDNLMDENLDITRIFESKIILMENKIKNLEHTVALYQKELNLRENMS